MPSELDYSTVGAAREHLDYSATCWRCQRLSVPVDLSHVRPDKIVTKLKPKCKFCGKHGEWTVIPKCTRSMHPREGDNSNG
ncbi:hypothetical protein ABID12_002039 [Martelella mangrovi]|uniref:Uncharacterized protein n=1 Tax=Martelella mangrovi TaxID=1397477 RepID=A0ABV2IBX4_9HYPH